MRRLLAFWALAAALQASPLSAADPVESFTLSNGMEVVVIPNHRVPAVSHMVWYRVGAADDPSGKSGLAHFHEHLMYEGTARYAPGDYAEIVARHGGEQNAFTGHDATSYYINIAKEQLSLAMELEADRMRSLRPPEANVAKEKQVIIEERRARTENNPEALLSEQIDAALLRHHPYRLPIIGWMHEMEHLTRDDALIFHRTWYHPNNAILIVSGDVTAPEVRALAQKHYGALAPATLPPRRWNEEPPQLGARRITLHHANVKQPVWTRHYAAPSLAYGKKEHALPLLALSQMMGGGKTSRLYQSIVVEQKLASGVDADYNAFTLGPSAFVITVMPEPGIEMAALEKAIDRELEKILAEGFSDADMTRAKTLLKAQSVYARDGLTSMARIMGWLRVIGLPKEYFSQWPSLIAAVTADQVKAAAGDTLQMRQSVTAFLLPPEKREEKNP